MVQEIGNALKWLVPPLKLIETIEVKKVPSSNGKRLLNEKQAQSLWFFFNGAVGRLPHKNTMRSKQEFS